jgi:hypothetical protein
VHRRLFRLEKRKLQTVRPMVLGEIDVEKDLPNLYKEKDPSKFLETYTHAQMTQLMKDSEDLLTGHVNQPVEPLVRIRIFHEKMEDSFNPIR